AAAANHIVPPVRGGGGDPTVNGATLRVYNSAGSGELATVTLPKTGWVALGSAANPSGYRFKSSDSSAPVHTVLVRDDRIKVSGGGASWTYTLNELSQHSVALRLTLGAETSGLTYCAEAGRQPYPARYDLIDRFVGM